VGDGDSAIGKAKEVKPELIMADVVMPGKNGYEVCEAVKNDPGLSKIPVMLLAGTFEPLNDEEASRVRADDHIVKPFESEVLIEKVKNLLERPAEAPEGFEAEHIEAEPIQPEPLETGGAAVSQESKPPVATDIWEAGDFLKHSEEVGRDTAESEAVEPDFDFLEEAPSGEAQETGKEEPKPSGEEFVDLDLSKEAPAEEKASEFEAPEPVESEPFTTEPLIKEAPAEKKASEFEAPEPIEPEPFTTEPLMEEAKEAISALPREKIEEIISKVARDVVEEVAWEVVPELAEELLKTEILDRVRESLTKKK
jgi:CheY-like chemotaxis protein